MSRLSRRPLVRRLALGAVFACLPLSGALAFDGAAGDPRALKDLAAAEARVERLESALAFFGGRDERAAPPSQAIPAQSSLADIAVRLDRLENQMRQLNGRLDEMQFQIRRAEEAQKRFQSDAEFRFQDLESGKGGGGAAKPGKRGDAGPAAAPGGGATSTARNDAIGGVIQEQPGDDPSAPMNIRPPAAQGLGQAPSSTAAIPPRGGSSGVSVGTGNPRDQFDMGVGLMQRRDYELAEQTFRDFLRANPRDALAPDAQYWLGESLYQRRQYTDAADSFYKIYVEAPQSSKAPESMMKLGMSLNGMGKKEEACATIAEAGRKYSRIKAQTDRELKRISC
ncbi:tol-pal system protein YbgF [Methylopila jiangsuensis]|uniref:Cell division coordinator CpoB n=1 Tax=Methylopila jiangsuensis TaxID=586230 RepID=A0A9W6N3F0_9HYPH|nr:tol-pal system protein YbgF [Methylopila jiangsuensis]MDR6286697.1 tol-pal system protein YbgF [Methylopila jiangsuensis]GLK76959.1 tol-pal system protein YbgF [Methylopila jiangsuensis]